MKFFWKYIFPPLYGLFFYTILRLVSDLTTEVEFWQRRREQNAVEIAASILLGYGLVRLPNYFVRRFEKKSRANSLRSITLEFGEILLVAMAIATTACVIVHILAHDYPIGIDDLTIVNVLLSLFLLLHYSIVRGNSFIRAYIEQKVLMEKVRNDHLQTELKFLKAQYHPHFLFNALNTIYFQMDEDVSAAKKSVEKFSGLLRYQLYDQQQTVPVSQEIRYLQNFIQLQQTRTSEKLRLDTHFDEHLDGQRVYPLLFLPLVENAFKYVGGDYRLCISATFCEDQIQFHVVNSIPAAIDGPERKDNGIGLENLKRRLELLYPGKHSFTIEKKDGDFSAALSIQLPPA
ncbi:MAG TPA: histidine kinase [Puia sp.]|jgi:sensor histidine kinase YesM|nr:histidine kinase [Puia sp.]